MFTLDKDECKKLNEWLDALTPDKNAYDGAIGGRLTYSFTPTSIGTIVKVKDNMSGSEIDLTDYESW